MASFDELRPVLAEIASDTNRAVALIDKAPAPAFRDPELVKAYLTQLVKGQAALAAQLVTMCDLSRSPGAARPPRGELEG